MVRNGLNIHRTYCSHWEVNHAIREVVQNTIDGSVQWAKSNFEEKGKMDLLPGGKGWYTSSTKVPRKFSDEGYTHAGIAYLVLTVDSCDPSKWKPPGKTVDWHKNMQSMGLVLMEVVGHAEIHWASLLEQGKQPNDTLLVRFETVNRISPDFKMVHLVRIGRTLKAESSDQAGKFGEGFKVGAVVAARNSFALVVETKSERRSFIIKKNELCYEKQDSKLSKAAKKSPGLIFVKMCLRDATADTDEHRFDPSFFRLLSPGTPFKDNGEILCGDATKGSLYCMGIFVTNRNSMLFGYDVASKDFITGRDRNGSSIHTETLQQCILELIEQTIDAQPDFISYLLKMIMELPDEGSLRKSDEVQAIFDSDRVCKELATCFRIENSESTFPCKESEARKFDSTFKNREKVVLLPSLVDLLRNGGFRTISEEIDYMFSADNIFEVSPEIVQPLIHSSIFRLNKVDEKYQVSEKMLTFIDGSFLQKENANLCCRELNGIFYINDALLSLSNDTSFLRASNKIGFVISAKVAGKGLQDFSFKYSEINNSSLPWFSFGICPPENGKPMVVEACKRILQCSVSIRAKSNTQTTGVAYGGSRDPCTWRNLYLRRY